MKEDVRIGFDFSQRILHGTETSRRCAEEQRAIRETREITPIGQRSEVRWTEVRKMPVRLGLRVLWRSSQSATHWRGTNSRTEWNRDDLSRFPRFWILQ